jgi:hypothetical protein
MVGVRRSVNCLAFRTVDGGIKGGNLSRSRKGADKPCGVHRKIIIKKKSTFAGMVREPWASRPSLPRP